MIKCESYPNHHLCRHFNTCELKIPITPAYNELIQEINFELKHLNELNQRKRNYFKVLSDIADLKYCETLCIKWELIRVPKVNALNEYITRPDDIIVDLNFNVISQEIKDTESIIRELRKKEQNILRILKKRADKYD